MRDETRCFYLDISDAGECYDWTPCNGLGPKCPRFISVAEADRMIEDSDDDMDLGGADWDDEDEESDE